MNRRQMLVLGISTVTVELIGCGGSPTAPTSSTPSNAAQVPARNFLRSKGGDAIKTFESPLDGFLYQALNAVGILVASRPASSKDTENGNVPFSGNLIYKMLIDGNWIEPENGFDFSINGLEYYDPMSNGRSMIADYYQFPVRKGDSISITLPPKWVG